jgi:hypothetical protein
MTFARLTADQALKITGPRPGADQVDYRDTALPLDQRIAAYKARNKPKQAQQADKPVGCPYCNDRHYVLVAIEWILTGLPADFDITPYADQPLPNCGPPVRSTGGDTWIACDCHPGDIGDKERPQKAKRFAEYFGMAIRYSPYGIKLLAYRRARAQARRQSRPAPPHQGPRLPGRQPEHAPQDLGDEDNEPPF